MIWELPSGSGRRPGKSERHENGQKFYPNGLGEPGVAQTTPAEMEKE
jgi:hypothetical protein